MPPRKTSQPPPYARATRSSPIRRKQLKIGGLIAGAVLILIYLLTYLFSSPKDYVPYGTPEVVIVTVLDEATMSTNYRSHIMENRNYYAEKQGWRDAPSLTCLMLTECALGYATFFPNVSDYDMAGAPRTWAMVPGTRHAMTVFPHSTYFLTLSPHALIMNYNVDIRTQITEKKMLESLMMRDKPVVPPDSVIRTFSHLRGDKIDLILTQDGEGLCQGSFILRRGEWAKFFLDTWYDPLYRSYNFQKAEGHALV